MTLCRHYILLLLLLLCTSVISFGQNEDRIHDIEEELKDLDNELTTKPFTTAVKVIELRAESDRLGAIRNQIMSNLVLAKAYEHQKNFERAYECIDSASVVAEEHNYDSLDFMLHQRKGMILGQQGSFDKSILSYEMCVEIARENEQVSAEAQSLASIGYAYTKLGEYDKALQHFDRARELFEKEEHAFGLHRFHAYMAIYYNRVGKHEKGIDESKEALRIATEIKDTAAMIVQHLNLLSNYAMRGKVDLALSHYNTRSDLINAIEYPEDRKIDLNIGVLYVKIEEYQEALDVLDICQDYYEREGNDYRVALVKHWKALAYRGLDRYDLSADYSKMSFETARTNDNKTLAQLSAYTLFQTYHWRGKDGRAVKWLLTSNEIKDSIFTEEKQREILALETKYETFRKEQEIEVLKLKGESDRIKRNQLWIGLISTFLVGGLLVYLQVMGRKKDKEIQLQRLQNETLEKEKLIDKLHHKEKQLASQLLHMAQKNEFLSHINSSIEAIKADADDDNKFRLQKVIRTISRDISSNETWDQFLSSFKEIHSNFIELLVNNYKLTSNEVRLASMMKMNMSSKEIGALLNISDDGVKKARYRLRKKLGLESDVNIQGYLLGLN